MTGKTRSGWIAILAALILYSVFPPSAWVYIMVFAGVAWGCWDRFFGAAKTSTTTTEPSPPASSTSPAASEQIVDDDHAPKRKPRPSGRDQARQCFPGAEGSPEWWRRSSDRKVGVLHTPVPVATPAHEAGFAIPQAPEHIRKQSGPGRWITQEEDIVIAGSLICGGMIYVGTRLKSYSGAPDPCLINPALPIAAKADFRERGFGYWPSYSDITPTARKAYLNWLAGGRCDPAADIGYVFLFFYGLERRAIVDGAKDEQAQRDWSVIAQELRRLLSIYGEQSSSFKRYASELLSWLEVSRYSKTLYNDPIPPLQATFDVPPYIRLALGRAAVDGVPVPAHLALAWVRLNPASHLRTPATRCVEQFDRLFMLHYAQTFKPGMVLPRNKTKLKLVYQPASAGLKGRGQIELAFDDTPDVAVLTAPQKKLKKITDAVVEQLDPYSRYLGRNPDAPAALEGLLLLPTTAWPQTGAEALKALRDRVTGGFVVLRVQDLLNLFQAKTALNKERAIALAKTLEAARIGIEPDILGGARTPKAEDSVVLYDAPETDETSTRTPTYQTAALTLELASAVANADGDFGEQEMDHLRGQVQAWSHLSTTESTRLLAYLHLLAAQPVSLASLKTKLEPLDVNAKETLAAFMAGVAHADGTVTPAEVKMLEKVYKALGLDPGKVFTDVHAVATGSSPKPRASVQPVTQGFQLDAARIAALQKDSERVSALLADVFKEEPTPAIAVQETVSEETPETGLFGMDETHSAFARMLLSRPQWTRGELVDVASDLDLMLDGALEHINDVVFDAHDIPFTHGDDPIEVNLEVLEKLDA